MMKKTMQWAVIGLWAMGTACTSLKIESWTNPEVGARPVGKVMILAVVERPTTCRMFEGYFVEQLVERGIDASSGHIELDPQDEITEEMLEEVLLSGGYDSIIITRLIGEANRNQVVHAGYTADAALPGYYGHYYGFYSTSIMRPVSYVDSRMEYRLETTMYDVQSGSLIWGGIKSVYDTSSQVSNIRKVVTAVVRELDHKKLL